MTKTIFIVFISILSLISCKHDTCNNRCASVQVVDRNSGIGIKNATVHFLWRDGDWSGWIPSRRHLTSVKTDENGFAHFYSDTPLTHGYFEIHAVAPAYATNANGTFIGYGQGWTPAKIILNPYGYIKVHVVDTTRNDTNVCIDFNGPTFHGMGLDTFFIQQLPSTKDWTLRYQTYRFWKMNFKVLYVDVIGNDTTMVEIKF